MACVADTRDSVVCTLPHCMYALQALEGAIAGLEMAQSESFRRLSGSISSSRTIDEDVVASAVQAEVWRSLEPVRQLPQMLSQTLPQFSADNKVLVR